MQTNKQTKTLSQQSPRPCSFFIMFLYIFLTQNQHKDNICAPAHVSVTDGRSLEFVGNEGKWGGRRGGVQMSYEQCNKGNGGAVQRISSCGGWLNSGQHAFLINWSGFLMNPHWGQVGRGGETTGRIPIWLFQEKNDAFGLHHLSFGQQLLIKCSKGCWHISTFSV